MFISAHCDVEAETLQVIFKNEVFHTNRMGTLFLLKKTLFFADILEFSGKTSKFKKLEISNSRSKPEHFMPGENRFPVKGSVT